MYIIFYIFLLLLHHIIKKIRNIIKIYKFILL